MAMLSFSYDWYYFFGNQLQYVPRKLNMADFILQLLKTSKCPVCSLEQSLEGLPRQIHL